MWSSMAAGQASKGESNWPSSDRAELVVVDSAMQAGQWQSKKYLGTHAKENKIIELCIGNVQGLHVCIKNSFKRARSSIFYFNSI